MGFFKLGSRDFKKPTVLTESLLSTSYRFSHSHIMVTMFGLEFGPLKTDESNK